MKPTSLPSRRGFLKTALFASTSVLCLPARVWAAAPGANGDIRVAVVGFGGRGGSHIDAFSKMKGVRVTALCDADQTILDRAARRLGDKGQPVQAATDVRKLLESKDIDVVSTATPNHWHSLITIWSCQAGKDVYVEKPVSHNVFEGRQSVAAARRYNRIVQTGTQSRSDVAVQEAFEWVRGGNLGRVKVARGLCYKPRPSLGQAGGEQPIPAGIDYDLWCGPALKLPLMRKKLHYDWHWVWNTGNGDLGNQGVHEMDKSRWALGQHGLPTSVFSIGGRLGYVDDGETANTQMIVFAYGESLLVFEVRGLPEKTESRTMDKYRGQSVGQVIECDGGWLAGTTAYDKAGTVIRKFTGGDREKTDHFENFIKAVRSRRTADLNADIQEGHISSALCHLGNISHRLGRQAAPDEIRASIQASPVAQESFSRMEAHLAANGVDIKESKLSLGPVLQFDPERERFVKNAQADALLTRPYRAPFIVPDKV